MVPESYFRGEEGIPQNFGWTHGGENKAYMSGSSIREFWAMVTIPGGDLSELIETGLSSLGSVFMII